MLDDLTELPEGWKETTLGESIFIEMGQSPSGEATNTEKIGVPLIGGASDLGDIYPKVSRYTSQPTKISEIGDLILCVRATIGRINYADSQYCLGRGVAGLRVKHFETDWVRYFLNYSELDLDNAGTGTTFRQIDKVTLQSWKFPLPPLNEQKRIVAKIEELRSHTQAARNAIAHIPKLLEQFRQSVLAAAFRGDLTAEWRSENPDVEPAEVLLERIRKERRDRWELAELEKMRSAGKMPKDDKWKAKYDDPETELNYDLNILPDSWCYVPLLNLIDPSKPISYGVLKPEEYVDNGVIMLRITDIKDRITDDSNFHRISESLSQQYSRTLLDGGEILISLVGTIGILAEVPISLSGANIHRNLGVLKPSRAITSRYLLYSLRSPQSQEHIRSVTTGANQPLLNLGDVKFIPIPITSIFEQNLIISKLENVLNRIDRIEEQYQFTKTELDRLDRSILAKAFKGELVPQDPTDEPAIVLLERIRHDRASQTKPAKTKRKKA